MNHPLRFFMCVLIVILLSCRPSQRNLHPQFKSTYDREAAVYQVLFADKPFGSEGHRSIMEQLPLADLREGDIILRLMDGASSLLTSFSSLGGFSHVGIVRRERDSLFVIDCQPHNAEKRGEHSVKKHTLTSWTGDFNYKGEVSRVLSVLVMRCDRSIESPRFSLLVDSLLYGCVQFDSQFELENDQPECRHLYCSEFVYVIFNVLLDDDQFIFFSDPITNKLIEQVLVLEKANRYPEFFRMLHVVEDRFQVKIRNVRHLISPSVFEWSPIFHPIAFAHHPDVKSSGYLPLMMMYAYLQKSIIFLRALKEVPVSADLEPAFTYARLTSDQKNMIRTVLREEKDRGKLEKYDTNGLICHLLTDYAASPRTFDIAGKAIARLERPKGHGRESGAEQRR